MQVAAELADLTPADLQAYNRVAIEALTSKLVQRCQGTLGQETALTQALRSQACDAVVDMSPLPDSSVGSKEPTTSKLKLTGMKR